MEESNNKKNRQSIKAIFTTLALFTYILLFAFETIASVGGTFTTIEGRVDILKEGLVRGVQVTKGDTVNINDVIRTKSNSYAEVTMADNSVIKIAPNSRVVITEALLSKDGTRKKSSLKLLKGKIKNFVTEAREGGFFGFFSKPNFTVETPSSVVGVKGTEFSVLYGGGTTTTFVDSGIIVLNSETGNYTHIIRLGANEIGVIGSGGTAVKTTDVPADVMNLLNRGLTGTLLSSTDAEALGVTTEDLDIMQDFIEELPSDIIPSTETTDQLLSLVSANFQALNWGGKGELTLDILLNAYFTTESTLAFDMSGGYNLLVGALTMPTTFNGNFSSVGTSGETINGSVWGTFDGQGNIAFTSISGNDPNWTLYFSGTASGIYQADPNKSTRSNEIGAFQAIGTGTYYDCASGQCAF